MFSNFSSKCYSFLPWEIPWSSVRSFDWLIDWKTDWLIDCSKDWLIDWLIDWSIWFLSSRTLRGWEVLAVESGAKSPKFWPRECVKKWKRTAWTTSWIRRWNCSAISTESRRRPPWNGLLPYVRSLIIVACGFSGLVDFRKKNGFIYGCVSCRPPELADAGRSAKFRQSEAESCPADRPEVLPRLFTTHSARWSGGNWGHCQASSAGPAGGPEDYHVRFLSERKAHLWGCGYFDHSSRWQIASEYFHTPTGQSS